MKAQWYVLHSKPHKETIVWQQLKSHGIEAFYPHVPVQPANRRARKIKPYFPRYLFVRVNLEEVGLSTLQWMPHTVGLVCFGGVPAVVPEALITTLERHLNEIRRAGGELFHTLRTGDPVVIENGPFAGYEAIFDARLSGNDRVRVLLKMLSDRYVAVELHARQIKKK